MSRVLVVEDSATQALQIRLLLEEAGFEVGLAANGLEALQVIPHEPPDLVLTDLDMPGMTGLELVETLRREHPSLPAILITQYGSEEIAVQALQRGAANYVIRMAGREGCSRRSVSTNSRPFIPGMSRSVRTR